MNPALTPTRALRSGRLVCALVLGLVAGCGPATGEGPGHRPQALALTPEQEAQLGKQAFREVLEKEHPIRSGPELEHVRRVGERIAQAAAIEPLQREIGLRMKGYTFDWEFVVLQSRQVNAFCLPGGKVAVFEGLFPVAKDDAGLATVMGHEISHALAHHASERIAREQKTEQAVRAIGGAIGDDRLIGLLAAGAKANSLKYDRQQESEADHIGLFLMTFAGYDPGAALDFWERMSAASRGGHIPEILSDHPSDAHRIEQIRKWIPAARAAKQAYDQGRIAPAGR